MVSFKFLKKKFFCLIAISSSKTLKVVSPEIHDILEYQSEPLLKLNPVNIFQVEFLRIGLCKVTFRVEFLTWHLNFQQFTDLFKIYKNIWRFWQQQITIMVLFQIWLQIEIVMNKAVNIPKSFRSQLLTMYYLMWNKVFALI